MVTNINNFVWSHHSVSHKSLYELPEDSELEIIPLCLQINLILIVYFSLAIGSLNSQMTTKEAAGKLDSLNEGVSRKAFLMV